MTVEQITEDKGYEPVEIETDEDGFESLDGQYDYSEMLGNPTAETEEDTEDEVPADGDTGDVTADDSGDEDSEEVVVEDSTPEPQTPDYPPELLNVAGQLGFSVADVKALGTPQALQTAVEKQIAAIRAMEPEKAAEPDPEPQPDPMDELVQQLTENEFDPKLIEAIKELGSQNASQRQRIDELAKANADTISQYEKQAEAYRQAQIKEQADKAIQWLDTQFDGLDESYKKVIGTGPSRNLSPGTPEYQARDRIALSAMRLSQDWQSHGFTGPEDPRLFQAAVGNVLGDHAITRAKAKIKSDMQKNGKQAIARPTQTQERPKTGREAAYENADNHPLWERLG